eukprot:451599-Pyramimonas_sp.AAC.1
MYIQHAIAYVIHITTSTYNEPANGAQTHARRKPGITRGATCDRRPNAQFLGLRRETAIYFATAP